MKLSRGLLALILMYVFQASLLAEYLYKDDVVQNPKFTQEVEKLGSELFEKTGVSLKLVMIRDLPNGKSIVEYEEDLLKEFKEPTILLTFAELNARIDIAVNDSSLYKYFNRKQVLSPVASSVQAFAMAVMFANSFTEFKEMLSESGGTILPLLADKPKKGKQVDQYAASMFNGYIDIADQVATSKGVELTDSPGSGSKNMMLTVKTIFYTVVVVALFFYIKNKIQLRRQRKEDE